MKHDLILTAKGHQGTQQRMEREFALIKLWEMPDRAAALKQAAPKIRALAHTGHSRVDAALMDALPKLEIIANFGVGVDQIDLDAQFAGGLRAINFPSKALFYQNWQIARMIQVTMSQQYSINSSCSLGKRIAIPHSQLLQTLIETTIHKNLFFSAFQQSL